jgi:excisionase family DNA binding protein
MDDQAYRPMKAAKVLGLSRSKIYELLAEGRLESVKIGRARLIKVSSIQALLNS